MLSVNKFQSLVHGGCEDEVPTSSRLEIIDRVLAVEAYDSLNVVGSVDKDPKHSGNHLFSVSYLIMADV